MKILASILLITLTVFAQDVQPPTVVITSPANYSTVQVNTETIITVNATDNDSGVLWVHCYIDGKFLAIDLEPPYECKWTPTKRKDYNVWAKASDRVGNVGAAQAFKVTAIR